MNAVGVCSAVNAVADPAITPTTTPLENEQLKMLLAAVEWRGRTIHLRLHNLNIAQYLSIGEVDGARFGPLKDREGFPKWWTWAEFYPELTNTPAWWQNPNDRVVGAQSLNRKGWQFI